MIFLIDNNELYHVLKHKDGSIRRKAKVVRSQEQAKIIFRQLHIEKPEPHQGVNRSLQEISKNYFWPRMSYDVIEWVRIVFVSIVTK